MPCSFTSLDKVRVEAALLFFGYDMTAEHTPWEVGLGFTMSRKSDYRGKAAAFAAKGSERHLGAGIVINHSDMVAGGETLRRNGQDVGIVNSPAYSHRLQQSLALVHLHPSAAAPGTQLEVVGDGVSYSAEVNPIPFYDPQKLRVRS